MKMTWGRLFIILKKKQECCIRKTIKDKAALALEKFVLSAPQAK